MKFKILTASFLFIVSCNIYAEPAQVQTIESLFNITKAKQIIEDIYVQTDSLTNKMIAEMNITEQQKEITANYSKKSSAIIREVLTWEKLQKVIIKAYQDNFTEEDLQAMITFYKSPAGQKFLLKTPEITKTSMAIVKDSIKDIMPKLNKLHQELEQELAKQKK